MQRVLALVVIGGAFAVAAVALCAIAQDGPAAPPRQGGGPGGQDVGGPGGPGGPGGGRPGGPGGPAAGFRLIPRFAVEKLNLTEDQLKQIAELEKETKAKLAKILTPEQMKTLEEARPPRPGQGGPGAQGGPGGGRRGPGGGGPGGGGPGGGGPGGGIGGDQGQARPQRPPQ